MRKPIAIEADEPSVLPERGAGLFSVGIFGDVDPKSMMDRKWRTEEVRKRVNYRDVIPCDRCVNCITLRHFTEEGEQVTTGYICTRTESAVDAFHTCNDAARNRRDRHKVFYDLTNAPVGFTEGTYEPPFKRVFRLKEEQKERSGEYGPKKVAPEGGEYQGGTADERRKGYKREELESERQMPRKLVN